MHMHEEIGSAIGSRVQTEWDQEEDRKAERVGWDNMSVGVGRMYRILDDGKA